MMIIIGCSNAVDVARKIAHKVKGHYVSVQKDHFPDGEVLLKVVAPLKKKHVVVVQSFHPEPQESLVEAVWVAAHAKSMGASRITFVAPYLGYMRQDKAFMGGQVVSARIMGSLLSKYVDHVVTVDPHLHRIRHLSEVFSCKTTVLSANDVLARYIKKHFSNEIIVGPDWESYQWAEEIAKYLDLHAVVLRKKRFSSHHVQVKFIEKVDLQGKNVVIVDDVISTGHTIVEAAKAVRKKGAKKVYCVTVHGLFAPQAIEKLKKGNVAHVAATNTIPNKKAVIDVSSLIAEALK
jgi:ribose-phosphate pyrophosphokinase